jgi:phage/plasmid-like protein (TIGR03299 family)
MAYNADRGAPWHRLGHPVQGDQPAAVMLELANANYVVSTEPLFVQPTYPQLIPIKVEGSQATVRTNADGTKAVLGVVGSRYQVLQNADALNRALEVVGASEGQAVVDTIGVLGAGERFFAYISLDDLFIDPTGVNDRIERGLLVYTSHDGSAAVTYANTGVRAVCQNTVNAGIARAVRVFRARHTASLEARLETAAKVMEISTGWAEGFTQAAEQLLHKPFTLGQVDSYFGQLFPVAADATDLVKKNADEKHALLRSLYSSARNAEGYGSNAWSAYNALVEYVDYYSGGADDVRAAKAMDENSGASKIKQVAFELALAS